MKKSYIACFIIMGFMLAGSLLFGLIYIENTRVREIKINPDNVESGEQFFEIEKIEQVNGKLVIDGWRVLPLNERRAFGTSIVLYDGENYIKIPTNYVEKQINIEENPYKKTGFHSVVNADNLKENIEYQIFIICRPDDPQYTEHKIEDYYVINTKEYFNLGE